MSVEVPLSEQEFDVIVIGTGFAESLLTGALSRAGKRVLQIDSNQSYGGDDASFPIDQFTARFASSDSPPTSHSENNNNINNNNINNSENNNNTNIVTGEIPLSSNASAVHNVSIVVAKQMIDDVESPLLSATQLRRCVVDLWPRLLFARSPMIDTLVRSGVNRYLEFKCLQACFMHLPEGGLALVPASKTQVFRDQTLSLLQKRSLMKLFSAIVAAPASDETPPSEEAPAPLPQTGSFDDVLVGAKLGTIASSFAKHAIALDPSPRTDDESSRERDIANCRRYAQSIGVYGATPFLASLYGTGELAQAYCRLGAVFGGIFVMQCGDVSLVPADDQTTLRAVRCKEGVIAAKHVVVTSAVAPTAILRAPAATHRLHLCACLLSGSLLPTDAEVQLPFIVLPPLAGRNAYSVYAMQLDPSMHVTSSDVYMLSLWTRAADDDEDNADNASAAVFERILPLLQPKSGEAPRELWRATWSRTVYTESCPSTFGNVHILSNAGGEVELDDAVRNVETLFRTLCPGAEFIERVPNPEDVDWSAPTEQQAQESSAAAAAAPAPAASGETATTSE